MTSSLPAITANLRDTVSESNKKRKQNLKSRNMKRRYHDNAKLWINTIIADTGFDLSELTEVIADCNDPDKHLEFALTRAVAKYKEFVEELTVLEERLQK
jgi:DNA-binding transcriptional MerR regulator